MLHGTYGMPSINTRLPWGYRLGYPSNKNLYVFYFVLYIEKIIGNCIHSTIPYTKFYLLSYFQFLSLTIATSMNYLLHAY